MARGRSSRGFSLVEAAVVVAVLTIMAGMMLPLGLKVLNQRREAATRKSLQLAFEAMFGARDRRVANMRADFGFEPDQRYDTLPFLVAPAGPWADVPAYGLHVGMYRTGSFPWGYNGPYWQGRVRGNIPLDAWGRPIGLRFHGGGWQVFSLGADGRVNRAEGVGDDLYYPPVPAPIANYNATVLLVVTIDPGRPERFLGGFAVPWYRGNRDRALVRYHPPLMLTGLRETQSQAFTVPAGPVELELGGRRDGRPEDLRTIPMDLLPGELREVRVTL